MKEMITKPGEKNNPRTIKREVAAENKWTLVTREQFLLTPDGTKTGEYLVVERDPALMIIPLIDTPEGPHTYMVKQYRYPIDKEVWQFPMGGHDTDTDAVTHAVDELRQETGLTTSQVVPAGEYYVDPGLSRQICHMFIAEGVMVGGEQELEETEEGMIAMRIPVSELPEMIRKGEIVDGWGFAGVYTLLDYVQNRTQ